MVELKNVTLAIVDCLNTERANVVLDICQENFKFADVKLLSSLDSGTDKIESINSLQEYSSFMIYDLVNHIDTDFVMCVQWDGFILKPELWTNDFLKYDYIGAPWAFHDNKNVGNGGFSIRSKRFLEVVSKNVVGESHSEDFVVGRKYRRQFEIMFDIKFAPEKLAHRFSFEANLKYGRIWEGQSLGFHGITLAKTDITRWERWEWFKKQMEKWLL